MDQDDKVRFYKNFLDEIKILYKLNHRNIVRIYNYYAYESIYMGYILMEYVDGEDIESYINNYYAPLPVTTLDDIFIQLIDAFCYIEINGIIHRDIRESNILVDKKGNIKIIDFGIGKVFSKPEETADDSLMGEINRAGSDTLPQEYYDGTYSSLTDMFYLAELFQRLIKNSKNCCDSDFSYWEIVKKMMEKQPDKRFPDFAAVRDAIGKQDFFNMPISEKDKKIYQDFTNCVYQALEAYSEKPVFNTDVTVFVSKLSNALSLNLFETDIQNNADVINSIVACSYTYRNINCIPTQTVKSFLDWFKSCTLQSQKLILNNFIAKLSSITVEKNEEYPF